MSKKPKKPKSATTADTGAFELSKPSDEIKKLRREAAAEKMIPETDHHRSTQSHLHDAEVKYKVMAWKGMEEDEEEELEEGFGVKKEPIPEDELDMTPMVDVTFLLLIFFMVTASFSLQKSIQQPPAQTDAPTTQINEIDDIVEDYVEIVIDQNNNYYVTSRDSEESEAPSDREMRSRLKDAKENSNATRLVIKAHLDCKHGKVVTVWDAGIAVGMNKIEIQTTELDY
jgi:biopolymer transport protein ExbD